MSQKIPDKQNEPQWATQKITIDGKTSDWGDHFEAYNRAVQVYYSIANDNNNLYLIVQATNEDIINKIYKTGLTFTVNLLGKKSDDKGYSIVYPIFEKDNQFHINIRNKPKLSEDTARSKFQADSFARSANHQLETKSKSIRTIGIKGVDTLISIYNTDGIKAASRFDDQMHYTLEFAIALQHLGLISNNTDHVFYHIKLKAVGAMESDNIIKTVIVKPNGSKDTYINLGRTMSMNELQASFATLNADTDFWGEYTLAKKP